MKYLVLDVETTISNDGDPFDTSNKLVCIGYYSPDVFGGVSPAKKDYVQGLIDKAEILVGFNFKFDLHWLQRLGLKFEGKKIYDVQLVDYILSSQTHSFPALDEVAYNLLGEKKLDIVKTEYWEKGIDTDKIPWNILSEYCLRDCELTYKLLLKQKELTPPYQKTLISLSHQDLLILQQMEYHGLRFDREQAKIEEEKALKRKEELLESLKIHKVPEEFNWASPVQLSALLYGGTLTFLSKVPDGIWKSGVKKGQVKFKRVPKDYTFPRKYKPIPGSEGAKKGTYSTQEEVLVKLGKDGLVGTILEIRAIDKLVGTYLQKLPVMQETHNWGKEYLYGQFNQTTTATGRLASSKPNLQNFPEGADRLLVSRFG